jgi:hypothetical protein
MILVTNRNRIELFLPQMLGLLTHLTILQTPTQTPSNNTPPIYNLPSEYIIAKYKQRCTRIYGTYLVAVIFTFAKRAPSSS